MNGAAGGGLLSTAGVQLPDSCTRITCGPFPAGEPRCPRAWTPSRGWRIRKALHQDASRAQGGCNCRHVAADSCRPAKWKICNADHEVDSWVAALDNINLRSEIFPWTCRSAGSQGVKRGDKLVCQRRANGTMHSITQVSPIN